MSQVDRNALLRGKVAFCTGTSSLGINHSIVRQWLQHGANVVLLGRRQHALDERVREFERAGYGRERVLAVPIDVRDPTSLARAVALTVERFGRIDILLNGAAGNFLCRSEDLSLNAARQVFEIDTLGAFAAVKATLNELKKTQGVILNISAMLHVPQTPLQLHASMAKYGRARLFASFSFVLSSSISPLSQGWHGRNDSSVVVRARSALRHSRNRHCPRANRSDARHGSPEWRTRHCANGGPHSDAPTRHR